MPTSKTSWGKVADWYDELVEGSSYQERVIWPYVERCLRTELRGPSGEWRVLDVGCGQGFFSRKVGELGAEVLGVDVSSELVLKAKQATKTKNVRYEILPAEKLDALKTEPFDVALSILALQNMSHGAKVIDNASAKLKQGGRLLLVLNHPSFRVPKASSWGWDEATQTQFRRVDAYLSESKAKIVMHPGKDDEIVTWSYHRPLQTYVKWMNRSGLAVTNIEEWVSDKVSDSGPRADAENRARKEIPLFMLIEAVKL